MTRVLSGIQPSGNFHLGNYFGALKQYLAFQEEAKEALFFVADLHALTSLRDAARLRALSQAAILDFLALGLDPQRAILFRQSDVPAHAELMWILMTVTPLALLERAHSYKDKIARGLSADAGLFTYPVLMAADILLYNPDRVPVGQDQKQHLEIARDLATKFTMHFVPGYSPKDPLGQKNKRPGVLKLPHAHVLEDVATVVGTDGQKMSKSYGNTIDLFGPEPELKKSIMRITTDSTPVAAPKPESSPLLALLRLLAPPAARGALEASWSSGGIGYGAYKKDLLGYVLDLLGPARKRREELARDPELVDRVLQEGAHKAQTLADPVIKEVRRAVGIGPLSI